MAASMTWSQSSSMGALRLSRGYVVSEVVGRRNAVLWMRTLELITPFAWDSNG